MTLSALSLIYSDIEIALRKYGTNFIKYFKWKGHRHQIETPGIPHPSCLSLDKFLDFCGPQCPHLKENMDVSNGTCPMGCSEVYICIYVHLTYVRHPVVPTPQ